MRRAALTLVAALLATGCSSKPHEPAPKYGEAAIAEVADRLKLSFGPTSPDIIPTLPDKYGPTDFYQFVARYQATFSSAWIDTLQKQGLQVGWPGDLRLLTQARGDSPQEFSTACRSLNLGKPVVGPTTESIFYCAKDAMSVPGTIHYPQGTLWVPIDALTAQWQGAKLVEGSRSTKSEQISQAAFAYITAAWADALTRQIRAFAGQWQLYLPVMERSDVALTFGYCIAGAIGWAAYGNDAVVPQAARIALGARVQTAGGVDSDPLIQGYTAALTHGFTRRSIGACISAYWVRSDALAEG